MKALVTGGAGFIGSHIVEALVRRGDSVRVLDNFSTGFKANLVSVSKRIELVEGDLRDERDVKRSVRGVDTVFHLAALRSVERSVHDPSSTNDVNVNGTLYLLQASRDAAVRRVVYTSSSSIYGDNKTFPQTEDLRPSPLSPYAVSKLVGELYAVVYAKTFGLETVSLRYFNVFGPRQHPESQYAAVIPKFMQAAHEGRTLEVHWDGRQSRDFTHVDNVVQANLLAARARGVSGQVFNVACGTNHSLLDIIRLLERFTGRRLKLRRHPRRAGDIRKTWADIRNAKKYLGYKPPVGFEEGLRRTWEWFISSERRAASGKRGTP